MLELHDQGPIRTLRLARPPANALNGELLMALGAAVARAPAEGVRGLILTGSGTRFSAGLDVLALAAMDAETLRPFIRTFFDCLARMAASPIPIVAAINGHSPAGGAVLALYCDHRIMARGEARIGLNEVQVGLYPGPLIHQVLLRTVGARIAGELLSSGAMLLPEEALAAGFIDEVSDSVVERAHAWLARILALPPVAYSATRALVRRDLVELMERAATTDEQALLDAWTGPETRAALGALLARLAKR